MGGSADQNETFVKESLFSGGSSFFTDVFIAVLREMRYNRRWFIMRTYAEYMEGFKDAPEAYF